MNIDFSRKLIKGKIAETVFEQMMREKREYTVIPFGYEHTVPTLTQYRDIVEVKSIIDNIADAPDFALISEDRTKIYLVEVKYQKTFDIEQLKGFAQKSLGRWQYPWLFIATPQGFYYGICHEIIKGNIKELPDSWASKECRDGYLELLNEFEK